MVQKRFGITNKKMGEMINVSVSGYSQKRSGINNQKFTNQNVHDLEVNFTACFKSCFELL